jgi:Dolichyl-phosphate-mannose-protein mannosyltransferase
MASIITVSSSKQRYAQKIAPAVIIAAFLISSAVWILHNQRVWWWDQAGYGYWTLWLWHARLPGVAAWADAMMHTLGAQQPLIAWIGQFFVPLRHLTGEFESAILFLNVFAAAGTLTLIYCTARRLGADVVSSLVGIVVCGGSGLFIGLTHQYLVEMTQCFAAASMMFAAWRAEKRSLARTFALLLVVVAVSFLSKSSSVTFVLPMITYIVVALWITRRNARPVFRYADAQLLMVAVVTAGVAATWYATNWQRMVQHFINSTMTDLTLHWGSPVNLPVKLKFWSWWFLKSLSPFQLISVSIIMLIAASLAISIVRLLQRAPGEWAQASVENGALFALALAGTIIATLFAFSLQINEDTRFVLPLIPAAGILVAWSLSIIRNQIVQILLFMALALNAAINHAYAHGPNPFHITPHNQLLPVDRNTSDKVLLTDAVRSSCQRESARQPNFIVVSYATLNVNSINFYSEKDGYMVGYRCFYATFNFFETDLGRALERIAAVAPAYIVTVAPERQPPPDFVNVVSRAVTEHLARDPGYTLAPGSGTYLLIYRKADPSKG